MRYSSRGSPRRSSKHGSRRISTTSPTLACFARSSTTLPEILLVGADPALRGLLEEWLSPQGYRVVESGAAPDLVLVDLAHPRRDGPGVLQRVARDYPAAPRL